MSDTSGAYPSPPPPGVAPPAFSGPAAAPASAFTPPPLPSGYKLPEGYQGPIAPDYTQPYQGYPQPYGQQTQAPMNPGALVFGGVGALGYQFGGNAAYSIVVGVLGIALPFMAGYYFRVLPIFGIITGVRAMTRGRVLGGAVGVGVNVLAGIVSLFASGLIH